MSRYSGRKIESKIKKDLSKKIVLLAGPRQCGKTSTSLNLLKETKGDTIRYLNWDFAEHRESIMQEIFPLGKGLIVLDEIHKFSRWRQVVKGLYDIRKNEISILVTGSGKLDHYSHGGDSLQGRYFLHRMYPFSLDEFRDANQKLLEDFFHLGPFPEPLLAGSEMDAKRWSRDYRQRLIQEDINTLESVKDLGVMEMLSLRLKDIIGSPLSVNSLREDLQIAHKTVSSWLDIFEALFFQFRIFPFGSPLIRALKKEPKLYLFDWTVITDPGARFENLVAFHLRKQVDTLVDSNSRELELSYFRDVDGREVDFVITENGQPIFAIETKFKDDRAYRPIIFFKKKFPACNCMLLFYEGSKEYTDKYGVNHVHALNFLKNFLPERIL